MRALLGVAAFVVGVEALALRVRWRRLREDRRREALASRAAALLSEADADLARFRSAIGMAPLVLLLDLPLTPAEQIAQGWAERTNRGASA